MVVVLVHLGHKALPRFDVAVQILLLHRGTKELRRILNANRLADDAGRLVHQEEFHHRGLQRHQRDPARYRCGEAGNPNPAEHPAHNDCGSAQNDALRRQIHHGAEFCILRRVGQWLRGPRVESGDFVHGGRVP